MKKTLGTILLLVIVCLFWFVVGLMQPTHKTVQAQTAVIELPCPNPTVYGTGSSPLPLGQANDQGNNGAIRQWACVDSNGNVFLQGLGAAPGVGTGPGGGGGGGGTGGGTGTAGGSCLSTSVLPGMVCAGPVPTSTGVNPTLQDGFANSGGTSPTGPATISGSPLTASPSIALMAVSLGSGGATNAPDASWTLFDNAATFNDFTIYRKNISSQSTLNLSSGFTQAGNTFWTDFLLFLGGTFSSIPHTATSSTLTCATGDNCATLTLNSVTANNTILMFGNANSNSAFALANATVTDSLGDAWAKVAYSTTPLTPQGSSAFVWIDQFASSGSHVLTIDGHEALVIIGGCCKAYELSGTASYFSGTAGPGAFRYLTTQDLINAGIVPGVAAFAQTNLGANQTVGNTDTSIMAVTIQAPTSGCPCRAFISYLGWADYAGVTNEPDQDYWISDGTTKMVPAVTGQSNASTGAKASVVGVGYSPKLYANGSSITFTLHGIDSSANAGTQTFVFQSAQPTGGSGVTSYLQVALIPSN